MANSINYTKYEKGALERIKELSGKFFNEVVRYRRELHTRPELSFAEIKNSVPSEAL